ncbi:trypsin-1-like [Pollicipes pollicipes]|uniref:trypsin-1-like n=1 Tax=Pollicipes pollicipes TaxID=41117 RepID=UPI0018856E8B|nr:trypsin-1-like [Pollicipes pollicipes]
MADDGGQVSGAAKCRDIEVLLDDHRMDAADGEAFVQTTAVISGFGELTARSPQPTELPEVQLPARSEAVCRESWAVLRSQICAGGVPGGGKSVSMGDSGGPLVTQHAGMYALIGVLSYGKSCGHAGLPDILMGAASFLDWIGT